MLKENPTFTISKEPFSEIKQEIKEQVNLINTCNKCGNDILQCECSE